MRTRIHAVAGVLALTLLAVAFLTSLTVELRQQLPAIVSVKRLTLYGVALLLLLLAVSGITGLGVVGKRRGRLIQVKQRRLLVSAVLTLLVLAPCAVALSVLAARSQLGHHFYALQALEWTAGGLNLVLLGLNMRDGLRLTGRLKKHAHGAGASAARKTAGTR